jgi:hypothetical protein
MTIIKDSNYWKDYNAKRKAYLQAKYLQCKQVVEFTTNPSELVVKSEAVVESCKNLQPEAEVVNNNPVVEKIIQPESVWSL